MIVELGVPFADTSSAGLRYLSHAPALPVLAELAHRDLVPDGHLSLRVLGASHQAVLTLPDGQYAETLACLDLADEPPPAMRTVTVGPWQCRLSIEVDRASPEALAAACRDLRRCAGRDDPRRSLYASFPGHPLAATFLWVRPAGRAGSGRRGVAPTPPAWETVHLYPESGERVRTRTEVHPTPVTSVGTPAGTGPRTRRRWGRT